MRLPTGPRVSCSFVLLAFLTVPLFAQSLGEGLRRERSGPDTTAPVPLPPAAKSFEHQPAVESQPISALVNGLSFSGFISYSASGSTARLTADRVDNASLSRTSGTLRLTLWMSTIGYRQTGYRTATYSMGQLPPNTHFSNVDSGLVPWTVPPTGCYYVSMLLEEFQPDSTYAYVDYLDFSNLAAINGGCSTSCSYTLSANSASKAAASSTGTVNVVGSPASCTGSWSSSANATWLSIVSGGSGSGSGTTTVTYSVGTNTSTSSRSGTLTLAGNTFAVTQSGATTTTTCTPSATTLCLSNSRYQVTTSWRTSGGQTGNGQAVPITSDTGYFWFFGSTNVEMVVKVIDACSFNQRFWVFAGGLTDVNVTLNVTDTKSGVVRTYTNPLGVAFLPIQDTSAFATCP
jgi:Putative binding domain, N-terminal